MSNVKLPNGRGWLVALFCLNFLLVSMAWGQDQPASQPAPDFAGVKQLQPDDTNLLVVGDVLPHIRRVLGNPAVQKMLKDGRLGKAIFERTGEEADAAVWLKTVEDQAQHIPTEIVAAFPDSAMAEGGHLWTSVLQLFVAQSMKTEGGDAAKDLPQLQKDLLAELKQLQMPRFTFWVKFRTPGDVRIAMGAIRVYATNLQETMPDAISVSTKRVTMKAKLSDQVDESTLESMLTQIGIVDDAESETGKAIVSAVKNLSMFAAVDMDGAGLKVTLSPDELPAPTGVAKEALGSLWKPGAGMLVYLNWNLKAYHEALGEVGKAWAAWENTPAGKALAEKDTTQMLANLKTMVEQSKNEGNHTALRMWADDGLHLESLAEIPTQFVPLADAPWIKMIPPGADTVALSGGQSVGQQSSVTMKQIDQILAQMGSSVEMVDMRDRIEKPLKELGATITKVQDVFGPTSAMILTPEGKLKKLSVTAPIDGEQKTITIENLDIMEVAALGVAKDGAAAEKLLKDAVDQVAKSVMAAADKEGDKPTTMHEEDLGLGVKTWVLDTAWMTDMAKPQVIKIDIDGDLKPHFFIVDNIVVMSTSPRLSKAIIAAGKAGKTFPLPAGTVVEYGRMGSPTVVGGLTMTANIIDKVSKAMAAAGMDAGNADDTHQAIEVVMGVAEMATMIDKMESVARREGVNLHANADMTFQPGRSIK